MLAVHQWAGFLTQSSCGGSLPCQPHASKFPWLSGVPCHHTFSLWNPVELQHEGKHHTNLVQNQQRTYSQGATTSILIL